MATKWYFRDTNAAAGPTAKASTDTDSFTSVPADKNTAKDMTVAKGTAQTSVAGAYTTTATPRYTMIRMFVSPPLAAQTLTASDTYTIGVGQRESNANMNLYFRFFVYIWRSGSGNVKTILVPTSDPTEEGTAETGCVHNYTGATGNYSILENDRIVCEVWADIRNTKNVSYTATLYYDGTTDVLEATATSDAASYMSFTQTLTGISTTTTIQKDLAFSVSLSTTIQNDLQYTLLSNTKIQIDLEYAVSSSATTWKNLSYSVIYPGIIQKNIDFAVTTASAVQKNLLYSVLT